MKNIFAFIGVIFVMVVLIICGVVKPPVENQGYLRIHIRANSNNAIDQEIKMQLKEELVNYLTPAFSECTNIELAFKYLKNNLKNIENFANSFLEKKGINYKSKVKLTNEYFPTRSYNGFTLESGFYDALIVELGKAEGENWWCVVYPPLCFVSGSENLVFKSKILEIIQNWQEKINKKV